MWSGSLPGTGGRKGSGEPPPTKTPHRALLHEHLPPECPAVLLHGDLLGQNIHIDPFGSYRPGLIDWSEAQMGDPALELAIVTRGVRRPFQTVGGREKPVEAYNRSAPVPITINQVRRYEMCMLADWIRAATERTPGDVEQLLNRFRRLLREMVADGVW